MCHAKVVSLLTAKSALLPRRRDRVSNLLAEFGNRDQLPYRRFFDDLLSATDVVASLRDMHDSLPELASLTTIEENFLAQQLSEMRTSLQHQAAREEALRLIYHRLQQLPSAPPPPPPPLTDADIDPLGHAPKPSYGEAESVREGERNRIRVGLRYSP